MIDFFYWPTPNGWKVSIMLEECGLPYKTHKVHIGEGDQFKPDFLQISPNNKIPAIVDPDGPDGRISLFESGAILIYLAEKSTQFMPTGTPGRFDVLQWLFWQVGNLGPMAGQLGHFRNYAKEKMDYPVARYAAEYNRLLGVLNHRLSDREYIPGDYSIADMATGPWVRSHERLDQSLDEFPHVARWYAEIADRPGVKRGIALGLEWYSQRPLTEEARKNLFGHTAKVVADMAKKATE
jgi:GST-like protein